MTTNTVDYKQALVSDTTKDTSPSMTDASDVINTDVTTTGEHNNNVIKQQPPPPPRRQPSGRQNLDVNTPNDDLVQRINVLEDKLQYILNTFGNLSMMGRPRVDHRNNDRQGRPPRAVRNNNDDDTKRRQGPRQQRKAKIAAKQQAAGA